MAWVRCSGSAWLYLTHLEYWNMQVIQNKIWASNFQYIIMLLATLERTLKLSEVLRRKACFSIKHLAFRSFFRCKQFDYSWYNSSNAGMTPDCGCKFVGCTIRDCQAKAQRSDKTPSAALHRWRWDRCGRSEEGILSTSSNRIALSRLRHAHLPASKDHLIFHITSFLAMQCLHNTRIDIMKAFYLAMQCLHNTRIDIMKAFYQIYHNLALDDNIVHGSIGNKYERPWHATSDGMQHLQVSLLPISRSGISAVYLDLLCIYAQDLELHFDSVSLSITQQHWQTIVTRSQGVSKQQVHVELHLS